MTYRAGEVRCRDDRAGMICVALPGPHVGLHCQILHLITRDSHAFNDHRGLDFVALTGVTGSFPRPG